MTWATGRVPLRETYFVSRDGLQLCFVSAETATTSGLPRAILAVIHGIAYHASPYVAALQQLVPYGFIVLGLDLRGHGRSDGVRGVTLNRALVANDIQDWLAQIRMLYPDVPIIMLAESMGGAYALWYIRHRESNLAGLVLVAPACVPAAPQVLALRTLGDLCKSIARPNRPSINLTSWRLRLASGDPRFIEERRSDPLALTAVSASYLVDIGIVVVSNVFSLTRVNCPVLILHGTNDRVLSPIGSRLLSKRIHAKSIRLVLIGEAKHTFLVDSTSTTLSPRLEDWLEGLL